MPNIFLFCSEEDARLLAPYVAYIGFQLRQASVVVLGLNGPEEVAFRIMSVVAGDNAARFEISAVASQSTDRIMKITAWCLLLATAWADLSFYPPLSEIADIFRGEVEVWPQMPVGWWGLYKQGKLLRD